MKRRTVPLGAAFAVLAVVAQACSTSEAPPAGSTASSGAATTSAAAPEPPPSTGPAVATPVIADVVAAPVPVPGTDGKVHLAYELQLTNVLDQEVTVTSVGVREGDRTYLDLSGDGLSYWMRIIGNPAPATKLGPAQTAIVWLDVALAKDVPVPTTLGHHPDPRDLGSDQMADVQRCRSVLLATGR